MTVDTRFCRALGIVALGTLVCAGAMGQVTSRFVVPGGSATSTKVIPGTSFSVDVRVDAPATATIGASFRVIQTAPAAPSSFFTITARDFTASIFNDATSGTADAAVLALPSAALNPDNDDNLGRNTIGLVGAASGINLFVEKVTFSVDPATPLGTYTIKPTPGGTSKVTDTAFADYDMALTAAFEIVVGQTLTIIKRGTGTGTVTSFPAGINCGPVCSAIYPGSIVELTATPDAGSMFAGWAGVPCVGTGGICIVSVGAPTTVVVTFDEPNPTLTVALAGTGSGTVTSAPAGITCNPTCAAQFAPGTEVTLTTTPAAGATFFGWSGVPAVTCPGSGTCKVTITAAQGVTATFNDTTAPIATITGFPTNPSNRANPQFTFASDEPGSTFKCQLDGGAQFTCTSPTIVNIGNGPHTFTVTATDIAGNTSASVNYLWLAAGIVATNVTVPTLDDWLLMLLTLLVGTAGVFMSRRPKD